MADPDQEEFQVAQAKPNLYDNVPGASPRTPPSSSKPPLPAPNAGSSGWVEPKTSKPGPELDKSLKDADKDMKAVQDASKQHPVSPDDLASWYRTLSPAQREKADQLQEYYKSKKYQGWFDPKIDGKDKALRDYLFGETSQQWRSKQNKQEKRGIEQPGAVPPDANDPEKFFGTGRKKRGELKMDAPAIAQIGGSYMEEADA